uniref:Cilia and flagella associated protein 52 n=1 Tax=Hucho hucho TaxID=62062 RepID=A0A4W5NQE4_9TELE
YPLGCNIILKSLTKKKQEFMHGHTNNVSCVTVSKSGKCVASWPGHLHGLQEEYMLPCRSTKPKWKDWPSPLNVKYPVTLGGQDDGREAICGSPASAHSGGHCLTLDTLLVWELNLPNRSTECQTGQLKTIVKYIWEGSFFYCDTSGDILKVNLKTKLLNGPWPIETEVQQGGSAGEDVTSIAPRGEGHQLFVGAHHLITTSHNMARLSSLPRSENDIWMWHTVTSKEVLHITVPNMTCIISAWNDGKICGFTPETGRLMMTVHNAHSMGVSNSHRYHQRLQEDCQWGGEGQKQQILYTLVRSVCYHPEEYQIITSDRQEDWLLEVYDGFGEVTDIGTGDSGSINSVKICFNNKYVISISVDGSILPWRYPHLPYYPGQNSPHPDSF